MAAIITLPGIGGSGEDHWQSHWERADPAIRRFGPASWDLPALEDWLAALDRAADAAAAPSVLAAHSLSCLLIAHWAARGGRARGAFLAAPPDPGGAHFPHAAAGSFIPAPQTRLPFPALVIASANDPYASVAYARDLAASWGADFVVAGAFGHINTASGCGPWPEGARLFEAFCAGL